MFGGLAHLIPTGSLATSPPKDLPPPTPINFPRCQPQAKDWDGAVTGRTDARARSLTALLQEIVRPTELDVRHFEALGVHVTPDVPPEELIPDPSAIPDFTAWESLTQDEAHEVNEQTRRPLGSGGLSPGVITYLDRRRELSIPNEAAFRAVRRIAPPPGQSQVRLGNSFEFFRNLDALGNFWDDTSQPPLTESATVGEAVENGAGGAGTEASAGTGESAKMQAVPKHFYRSAAGSVMPPEYRHNIVTAFLKLVAYDFGCNVSAPRTEPRLYLNAPPSPGGGSPEHPSSASSPGPSAGKSSPRPRSSYFSSGCAFIFRTPTTRAEARAGVVEGPVAAVSPRHTTSFPPPRPPPVSTSPPRDPLSTTDKDSTLDLARELLAALLTAQHRRREGRTEKRIGEGAWWATKPRWGGGPGGPIGREVDASGGEEVVGDKDEIPSERAPEAPPSAGTVLPGSSGGKPVAKKARRNLAIYDNYRMVRPPAAAWDKKTRYAALGRRPGTTYDDIFVVSALFHHVAIVRVRVPDRLLDVLDGASDEGLGTVGQGRRSWGRLEVWRSPWYDFFKVEERIKAMRLVWAMMAYLMNKVDSGVCDDQGPGKPTDGDVRMTDA